jgi:hypothetical protein
LEREREGEGELTEKFEEMLFNRSGLRHTGEE